MELWIRSQDREDLINNPLRIYYDSNYEGVHKIIANTHDETIWLGKYKTKERALEILNEIESFLVLGDDEFDKYGICNKYYNLVASKERMIYVMPEE